MCYNIVGKSYPLFFSFRTERRTRPYPMIADRFYTFVLLIGGVHKCISQLKFDFAPSFGVKSVHIFWVYELYTHPEGLTAAELASRALISRSLVSREIECLLEKGYVQIHENAHGKRKNYNARITLTEKGRELAADIQTKAKTVQAKVSKGISEEELTAFYITLGKLYQNMQDAVKEDELS